MTVVIVTVVKVTVVIFVTLVIVTVATVAVGTVVIATYFSKNNLTPWHQVWYSQGSFLRFSRCFFPFKEQFNFICWSSFCLYGKFTWLWYTSGSNCSALQHTVLPLYSPCSPQHCSCHAAELLRPKYQTATSQEGGSSGGSGIKNQLQDQDLYQRAGFGFPN